MKKNKNKKQRTMEKKTTHQQKSVYYVPIHRSNNHLIRLPHTENKENREVELSKN